MKIEDFIQEIREYLNRHSNPAIVKKYEKYFKEGYNAYGIDKEFFRELLNSTIEKCIGELSLDDLFLFAEKLLSSGKYEEASLVISLMSEYKKRIAKKGIRAAFSLSKTNMNSAEFDQAVFNKIKIWLDKWILNWAHTDIICSELLGSSLKAKELSLSGFQSWKNSPSKWTRRAVPVSMISLLKVEEDFRSLLDFIETLMLDKEKPVQQGLGWFLREAWKKQPEPVEEFLLKWKETAPRVIFQYATEKMDKEQKELFRRSKRNKKLA